MTVKKLHGSVAREPDGTPCGRIVGIAVYIGTFALGIGYCTKLPPRRITGWPRYVYAQQFGCGAQYHKSPPQWQIRLLWAMAGFAWKVK